MALNFKRNPVKVNNEAAAYPRLAEIKKLFIDYRQNPQNYIDIAKPEYCDGDTVVYRRKPLANVMGLEKLGAGAYSSAYALDENKVLKITTREDNGYETFVKFLKAEGYKYSAFPKLYYSGDWEGTKVYIIERMETISDDNNVDRQFLASYCRDNLENCRDRGRKHEVSRFVQLPQDFNNALEALYNWYQQSRNNGNRDFYFDLHSENVMIRPNGDPVIIDPFS